MLKRRGPASPGLHSTVSEEEQALSPMEFLEHRGVANMSFEPLRCTAVPRGQASTAVMYAKELVETVLGGGEDRGGGCHYRFQVPIDKAPANE